MHPFRTMIVLLTLSFVLLAMTTQVAAQTGSLTVTITPAEALSAGAQWRRTGQPDWRNSGTTEQGVSVGNHEVEFRDARGWVTPQNTAISIVEDDNTSISATYERQTGSVQVIINPEEVRDIGAQWRLSTNEQFSSCIGTCEWRNSGDIYIDVPVDDYIIEFIDVEGWMRPANNVVTIIVDATVTVDAEPYTQPHEEGGSIQVVIEPAEARTDGARWRVTGTTQWKESGETIRGLSLGNHTIEYNIISGWDYPPNEQVSVVQGETSRTTGVYTQTALGALQVIIEPDAARTDGAQWRRAGTTTWLDSGVTEEGIPTGNYDVEFKAVSGWIKPSNASVTIVAGQTEFSSATYDRAGALQVIIDPETARNDGAQWRRAGTATWFDSGYVEENIPTGDHDIEFKAISDWEHPQNQTVSITDGATTRATGVYTPLGALQVIIEPEAARTDGAQWRRAGTTTWFGQRRNRGRDPNRRLRRRIQGRIGLDQAEQCKRDNCCRTNPVPFGEHLSTVHTRLLARVDRAGRCSINWGAMAPSRYNRMVSK